MPRKTNFPDLSEDQCKLLFAILQMQRAHPAIKATKAKIIEYTGFTETKIGKLLHEIRTISRSRYVERVKGSSPTRYRLFTQRLITQAETARVLLYLIECPFVNADGLVYFQKAVRWIKAQTGLTEQSIRSRIDKAIKQEYLTEVQSQGAPCLEKSDRLVCKWIFLKMIVENSPTVN